MKQSQIALIAVVVVLAGIVLFGVFYVREGEDDLLKRVSQIGNFYRHQTQEPEAPEEASSPAPLPAPHGGSRQPPRHEAYPSSMKPSDLMGGFRKRSNKAAGITSEGDADPHQYNHNMVGSYMAPMDPKSGSSRAYFPSAPMAAGSQELGTASVGSRRGSPGVGKGSKINLDDYAHLLPDRTVGAQGLDHPNDLVLASAQIGHMEVAGNTRTQSWHPHGETPYSWRVGYTVNSDGQIEPGNGIIPTYGPGQLALRTRGVNV
jgi:hypothetical protein